MQYLNSSLTLLKSAALLTLNQFLAVLGIFFLFGLVLFLLARFTRNTFIRSVGFQADIFWTGWIGTPVHELGHAVFCILFGHRITEMRLFKPDSRDGSLGYVNHSFNSRNLYHRVGNLFIGAGPIIIGSLVLYAAMYFFAPSKQVIQGVLAAPHASITGVENILTPLSLIVRSGQEMIVHLWLAVEISSWKFWVFLYLSISIASHMELSPDDIKGMWSGLVTLLIILFMINLAALPLSFDVNSYILKASNYTGMLVGLFIFAVIVSTVNFILVFVTLSFWSALRHGKLINPVW
jgi:hypothetical protein